MAECSGVSCAVASNGNAGSAPCAAVGANCADTSHGNAGSVPCAALGANSSVSVLQDGVGGASGGAGEQHEALSDYEMVAYLFAYLSG